MKDLKRLFIERAPPHGWTSVIFDYDGTIAKVPVEWPSVRRRLRESFITEHRLDPPEGLRVDELEKWALDIGKLEPAAVFAMRTEVESAAADDHEPISEVVALIHWLVRARPHLPLFVLSNNLRSTVKEGLQRLNIANGFVSILGVDDTLDPKPGTTGFDLLKRDHAVEAARALFFGDSDSTDGAFCRRLHLPFINIKEVLS